VDVVLGLEVVVAEGMSFPSPEQDIQLQGVGKLLVAAGSVETDTQAEGKVLL